MDQGAVGPDKTDGVTFGVSVRCDDRQLERKLHHATDERRPIELELTPLAGKRVAVELSVHPGPARSPSFDWARWFRPRIERAIQTEGVVAVAGSGPWKLALCGREALAVESEGGQHRFTAPQPGTVLLLRDRPAAVELPVDLIEPTYCLGFLGNTGAEIEPSAFVGMTPGRAVVGGVERNGIHAHPPNQGRTIAQLPITLPTEPAVLRASVGIRDGSRSTGVLFVVEVNGLEVARRRAVPGEREPLEADLSPWAGKPVVLSLVTDSAGPYNFDWAHWADPRIEAKPQPHSPK